MMCRTLVRPTTTTIKSPLLMQKYIKYEDLISYVHIHNVCMSKYIQLIVMRNVLDSTLPVMNLITLLPMFSLYTIIILS